jgi:peptidoglycan/xylan/chitin deacetylase (PgdA/CDA1 family)
MNLVITIDTEEDNWNVSSPTDQAVENIERLPLLQDLFDEFAVKPTYLITYPVATNDRSVSILRAIVESGRCEIGAHCHPWNTPPIEEEISNKNSMLCNLPIDLQYRKLYSLDRAIQESFGVKPVSFRAGRWGYNHTVAANLCRLGYKIDSSITPYTNWTGDHGPNFSHVSPQLYSFSSDRIFHHEPNGPLIEIPATIGYLQKNFALCTKILQFLERGSVRRFRLVGLLNYFQLISKVWLSPEVSDEKRMIQLAEQMRQNQYGVVNMFFHSTSVKAGLSPFVKSAADETRFRSRIREFLTYARDTGMKSVTLADYSLMPQAVRDDSRAFAQNYRVSVP